MEDDWDIFSVLFDSGITNFWNNLSTRPRTSFS